MQQYHRENIHPFDEHTTYLCAGTFGLDADNNRFVAALSTENLLLNAFRQLAASDITIYVDSSYRYMYEGWGLVPIKVCSHDQMMHTIAYGLSSHDDERNHEYIFRVVKKEVERVVNDYKEIYPSDHLI